MILSTCVPSRLFCLDNMRVAYSDIYHIDLPDPHRFPMEKYSLLYQQLLYEGVCEENEFFEPDTIEMDRLFGVHSREYLDKFLTLNLTYKEQRATGFMHTPELVEREKRIVEGTRKCAEYALDCGIGLNIAGGTHHAYSSRGEGFCMLNDQGVAANWLLEETSVSKVLIVDLDVHQGNGTAEIFRNNDSVFTFSMHCKNNYPLRKEISDRDIELDDACGDDLYLITLDQNLKQLFDEVKPDFVFYQCGVDVLETDKLGRLGLSKRGCMDRDRIVFEKCFEGGVPVTCSMGGGYSPRIADIVDAHVNTFKQAKNIYE